MPEKIMLPTTLTWPRPPRTCPTRLSAKRKMRMVIWLVFRSSAARMKNGTAISRKESMLFTILIGTAASGTVPLTAMAMRAVRPSANGTGTASRSRKTTNPPKIRMRPSYGVIGGPGASRL